MSIGSIGDINSFINMKRFDPMKEINNLSSGSLKNNLENNPVSIQNYMNSAFNNNQSAINNDTELQDDLKVLTKNSNMLQGGVSFNQPSGAINSNGVNSVEEIGAATPANVANSFSNILKNQLMSTTNASKEADNLQERFAAGDNIDIHTVMIAAEKASTSMQFTMQLRNKMLQAYQEVSRMQI